MGEEYLDDLSLSEDPSHLLDADALADDASLVWRRRQEQKILPLDMTLSAALGTLPPAWLSGVLLRLGLPDAGTKREKIERMVARLEDADGLRAVVAELPALSRAALRDMLDASGWLAADELIRQYGDDSRDGWFWNEELPESPLGLLRISALLYIGSAERQGRGERVALIPSDLRQPLAALLADETVLRHNSAQSELILDQVLLALGEYALQCGDWLPPLSLAAVEDFLSAVAAEVPADDLWAIWNDLNYFLFYLEHFSHEIASPQDLRDYHLSELVNEFMQARLADDMGLAERRRLLNTIARLYDYLAAENEIERAVADRIAHAVALISAGTAELRYLQRPDPLGGEPAVELDLERGPVVLTFNDLWLLITAAVDFGGSLEQLGAEAERVVDGERKRRCIERLLEQDCQSFDLPPQTLTPELIERSRHWFYQLPLSQERVW